jgi:hypothetical protein
VKCKGQHQDKIGNICIFSIYTLSLDFFVQYSHLKYYINCYSITSSASKLTNNNINAADMVEPPKFITSRHVSAVFEKLGYDAEGGQKIFNALCAALQSRSKNRVVVQGTILSHQANDDGNGFGSNFNGNLTPGVSPAGKGGKAEDLPDASEDDQIGAGSISVAPNAALAAAILGSDSDSDDESNQSNIY